MSTEKTASRMMKFGRFDEIPGSSISLSCSKQGLLNFTSPGRSKHDLEVRNCSDDVKKK
jgi:hypothetical protein